MARCSLMLVVIVAVGLSSLARAQSPADERQARANMDRSQLIAQMFKRGDEAMVKGAVPRAYAFAAFFVPDEDPELKAKLPIFRLKALLEPFSSIDGMADLARGFTEPTEQTDIINLRMLLDERIVGDLSYSEGVNTPSRILIFQAQKLPIAIDIVKQDYGTPTSEEKRPDGRLRLTYGRVRVFADPAGQISGALFAPTRLSQRPR